MIDDHGVSNIARGSALATLLEEPERPVLRHYAPRGTSVCGGTDGYRVESDLGGVTCEACLAWMREQREKHDLGLLRRLAVRPVSIRRVDRHARHRLVGAGLAKVVGASVVITDAGKARAKESA